MRAPSRLVAGILLASLALAGCFGEDATPAAYKVTASGGKASEGWAYDGAGLADASATLDATLDHAADSGSAVVSFQLHGSRYEATFDRFVESKPFQAGGIVFGLDEHGDTGVADASIPRIHALAAAWGTAKVTKDGQPLVGKAGDAWAAHLMVSRDTVRGADGKITKADGATPYDPASPADARRVENDPQALFFIKHPDGETSARPPVTGSQTLTLTGPEAVQTAEVPSEAGVASVVINVTVAGGAAPVPVGQVSVRVLDAEGNELASQPQANVLPEGGYATSFDIPADKVTGPLKVEVRGSGAFSATVDHVVAYDDHPFIVITWDDVTLTGV